MQAAARMAASAREAVEQSAGPVEVPAGQASKAAKQAKQQPGGAKKAKQKHCKQVAACLCAH